jgi:hypothetical protein
MAAELLGRMDAVARGAPASASPRRSRITLLRRPHDAQVHKGRSVLRPEVCRTRTFGEQGSSAGQFFGEYLSRIELSTRAVVWSGADVSYLRCAPTGIRLLWLLTRRRKQAYDDGFFAKVRSSRVVRSVAQAEGLTDVDARIMWARRVQYCFML